MTILGPLGTNEDFGISDGTCGSVLSGVCVSISVTGTFGQILDNNSANSWQVTQVTEQQTAIPTLSEWGIIALSVIIGILGNFTREEAATYAVIAERRHAGLACVRGLATRAISV